MSLPQNAACSGFVLAGGHSSRMGKEKALLEINGTPLVVRAARLLEPLCSGVTIVGPQELYQHFGFAALADERPNLGPLGGILTALGHTEAPWILITACDLPYLTADWLRYLIGRAASSQARVVLPESDSGPEPLCAVYHRDAAAAIRSEIARGERKVTRALGSLPIERLLPAEIRPFDPRGLLFHNLNTPEDYERARADLEAR
ncbi:MAG TPA: molybdenum cofactor guanylyltransferase [Candidatus Acidoferrales bacterium]|nr:molybdenum cofactor guanylyltransferase [Candidatus Acidoferrales bacterium]